MGEPGLMSEFPAFQDQALKIVNDVVAKTLKDQGYAASKCAEWIDLINNHVLDQLRCVDTVVFTESPLLFIHLSIYISPNRDTSPNFKYIVNCLIVQKIGAGIHYEARAFFLCYLNKKTH